MPHPFTPRQAAENAAFLRVLARHGNARLAAAELGVHRATYTRRRASHAAFAAAWEAALASADLAVRAGHPVETAPVRTASGRLQLRRAGPGRIASADEARFLRALAASANVRLSAAAAGFAHTSFYWRKRRDPDFAARMADALALGYDRLELALLESACNALDSPDRDDETLHPDCGDHAPEPVLPPMTVDGAFQLLRLHHRTQREGLRHPRAIPAEPSIDDVKADILRRLAAAKRRKRYEDTGHWEEGERD